jgi:translation initiation factor IF-3
VTDEHDYAFKKKHILQFLKEGDKVKAVVHFKGREISHSDIGRKMMARLIEELADVGTVEFNPRMEGSDLNAIFAPKK